MATLELIMPEEAAKRLCISVKQLRDLTDAGYLRWINIGLGGKRPTRRYTETDLQAFIEERSEKACRSTRNPDAKPTPTTSSYRVVDFQETLAKLRSEKRKGSKTSGKR